MLISDKTISGKLISEIPWYSRERVVSKCNICDGEEIVLLYTYNKRENKDTCSKCATRKKNGRYLTDADREKIKQLYESKETIDKIAKIIKKPEYRISAFLNEIGYIKNTLRVHFKCSVCLENLGTPSASSVCKRCISIRETTYKIDISIEEYFYLNKSQKGLCKICGKTNGGKRLFVDHCHQTGDVRGLLCGKCNSAIGFFKDDANAIKNAIIYIKSFNQNLSE
jgi:hypothetical protein